MENQNTTDLINQLSEDIAPYSDNEAKRRQLEQEIEVLQTKYDNSTTRNAYILGGKLRAKQAEFAALKGE